MHTKILTFIKCGDKFLALRNNHEDLKHGGDFWYVVTGNVNIGEDLKDAVLREVKEETNLEVESIIDLNLSYEFENHNQLFKESCFLVNVNRGEIILNNEHIEYQWLDLDDFIEKIKWFDDKDKLKKIFNSNLKYFLK